MVGPGAGKCKRPAGLLVLPAGLREKAPMFDRDLDCLARRRPSPFRPRPRPAGLAAFLAASPHAAFSRPAVSPRRRGRSACCRGRTALPVRCRPGDSTDPHLFGALPFGLPPVCWRVEPGDFPADDATLGFCLGAYQFTLFKPARPCATLAAAPGMRRRRRGPPGWSAT